MDDRSKRLAVAVLEIMWDWRAATSSMGYGKGLAPRSYRINPNNFTGRRLYNWLGTTESKIKGSQLKYSELKVTNACPQLVNSASGRGIPDANWLRENLEILEPIKLLLVCGKVAQETFVKCCEPSPTFLAARILFVPHPAARMWTSQALSTVRRVVQEGQHDVQITIKDKRAKIKRLDTTHLSLPF